ncbi:hypothetical protein BGZ80_004552 [Entomortierella chlamydospora]|uniref:Uncharacterized protein n=1 Tax=Entomortierella chlamydospora TaxID=101097 RepID=A0A9P6SVZ4_9FUNG|nr:hypothetical protein BGZ80_004552 [Entomortierella chlamydospora]
MELVFHPLLLPHLKHTSALLALPPSAILAAASTDKSVWTNKLLQDWDNGWDVNSYGEPLDVNTAWNGKPCVEFSLTKPVAPVTRKYQLLHITYL